jgi:hypothetical protein
VRKLFALLVALAGAGEIGAQWLIASRVPGDDEWKAAAAYVRARQHPGDGIVFAPEWVDPIGRLHLGDRVPVEEAARPDRSRQGRIWEVSIRGSEHPQARGRVAESRVFGRVRVRRIERRAREVLYDFSAAAPERRRVGEVDFLPYACLHATPPATLDFHDVPIGRRIALHGGIHDFQSRYRSDAPVTVEVRVDERRVALERFDNRGWRSVAIDTAGLAGRRARVAFGIDARRPLARTLCFHAEVHR